MREKSRWNRFLLVVPALLLLGLLAWTVREQRSGEFVPIEESVGERASVPETIPADEMMEDRPVLTLEPESEPAVKEDKEERKPVLLFGGDVYLSEHVLNAYDGAGGVEGVLDEELRREISDADIFMVNQEFPFSERGAAAADKTYTFRLPLSRVSMMNEMGIDIVTLANNHALDYGTDALLDTCAALDGVGILRVGAGANLEEAKRLQIVEQGGIRFGFLGASRVIPVGSWMAGASTPGMFTTYEVTLPQVLEEIEAAREQCDFLVVYVHWGIERDSQPQEYQRTMGKKYIDAGADLVIGSHPHVLQGIEYYNGRPIVYSLGNFVFGSSIPKTMLLAAEVGAEGTKLRLIPGTSSAGYTRMLTDEVQRQTFYREMEELSFGISVDEQGYVIP